VVSSTTPACFLRHVEVDRRRCRSDDPPSLRRDGTRRGLHRAGACISRSLPRHSLKLDNITKKNICIATGFAPLISSAIDRSHGMHSLDDMRRREARAPIRPALLHMRHADVSTRRVGLARRARAAESSADDQAADLIKSLLSNLNTYRISN